MSTGVGNHNHGLCHDNPETQIQTKNLNASYSEDSVAETALSKKNSDGLQLFFFFSFHKKKKKQITYLFFIAFFNQKN